MSFYPDAAYRLLGDADIRAMLAEHFEPAVQEAYRRLKPYAYRADLARYCLLYLYGGLYVDLGVTFHAKLDIPPGVTFFAFREMNYHTLKSWGVACAILYAEKGHPVLARAIQAVVKNCETNYYGVTPLCPTGPTLLGRAICKEDSDSVSCQGELMDLTPTRDKRNRAFVLDDGTIVAFGKSGDGGDLTHLGLTGTNNYNHLWGKRRVYGPRAGGVFGRVGRSGVP